MNSQLKIKKIAEALTSIEGLKVYHYYRTQLEAPYCIWSEDMEGNSLQTSNHKVEQAINGTIDYFTQEEFDENIDAIQDALNGVENCYWSINSIQYEEDTELIHYEWTWSVF